jgi:ABC-type sulfate transport system substrate-binding protein
LDILAQHHLRPRDKTVSARHAAEFKPIRTFTVEQMAHARTQTRANRVEKVE